MHFSHTDATICTVYGNAVSVRVPIQLCRALILVTLLLKQHSCRRGALVESALQQPDRARGDGVHRQGIRARPCGGSRLEIRTPNFGWPIDVNQHVWSRRREGIAQSDGAAVVPQRMFMTEENQITLSEGKNTLETVLTVCSEARC